MPDRDEAATAPCPQVQPAARLKQAHSYRTHIYTTYINANRERTGRRTEHSCQHRHHQQPHVAPFSVLLVPIAKPYCAFTLKAHRHCHRVS